MPMLVRPFVAVLGAAVLTAASTGCIVVNAADSGNMSEDSGSSASGRKETRTLSIAHAANMPLAVATQNGSVEISRWEGANVSVTAEVRAKTEDRLAATTVRAERDAAGTLSLSVIWPDGKRLNNEGVSFTVRIPDASQVDVNTSNGRIRVEGVGEAAVLQTSNAAISARDIRRDLKANTSNGGVTAENIGGDVTAQTSNASIVIRDVAGKVDATTSNGKIDARLAQGSTGPFRLVTSNGSISAEAGSAFAGEVSASTSNGSIRFDDGTTTKKAGTSFSTTIGSGGAKSTARTSNGSVDIRIAASSSGKGSSGGR